MPKAIRIISCSPRVHGNSDFLSSQLAESFVHKNENVDIIYLRDYKVQPCNSCGYCAKLAQLAQKSACSLDTTEDNVARLFDILLDSKLVIFVSPIYFYHLPAQFKAFLDRMQRYWKLLPCDKPAKGEIPVGVVLISARAAGVRLFDGSILSLRYACECMGLRLAGDLKLMGYEDEGDIAKDASVSMKVQEFVKEALDW